MKKLNHECLRTTEPKNVIFLDIDGVLNNMRCLSVMEMIDIECARHVRRICRHADADIVISSSWRIGSNTHNLREILYTCGLMRVIGMTCTNHPGRTSVRGDEIQAWIDEFGCKNYVILDDDQDMLKSQKENFIKTDATFGITEQQSTFAIRQIFGINKSFCPECNGYGITEGFNKCGSCNNAMSI